MPKMAFKFNEMDPGQKGVVLRRDASVIKIGNFLIK